MTKRITPKKAVEAAESDSAYFLKIVLYIILGATWIKFAVPLQLGPLQLNGAPVGMLFGVILASHDHFAIDRKVEYALLVMIMIITYFLPAGIVL